MKYIAFFLPLLLAGCGIFSKPIPIAPKWPEAIPELREKCAELSIVEGDRVPITELLKTVVQNYQKHYECSAKNDGWNTWYDSQKKIYEDTTSKK